MTGPVIEAGIQELWHLAETNAALYKSLMAARGMTREQTFLFVLLDMVEVNRELNEMLIRELRCNT